MRTQLETSKVRVWFSSTMGPPLPPLNALRAFEAAGRLASFMLAARELHVTTAAISHPDQGRRVPPGVRLFAACRADRDQTGTAAWSRIHEGSTCFGSAPRRCAITGAAASRR